MNMTKKSWEAYLQFDRCCKLNGNGDFVIEYSVVTLNRVLGYTFQKICYFKKLAEGATSEQEKEHWEKAGDSCEEILRAVKKSIKYVKDKNWQFKRQLAMDAYQA